MAAKKVTAAQLRKLDRQLVDLLNERAAAAIANGELAEARGESAADQTASGVADPAVLKYATENNDGPLTATAIQAIFRELLSGIRSANQPIRAAYLGPAYTYSHLAAIARFGQSAELVPVATIASVFDEVEQGHAQFGVVPIENSTDGRVADSLECLARLSAVANGNGSGESGATHVQICGEVPLRIHHCLLGRGARSEIRRVCSKPQALSQCRNWLAAHLPGVKLEPASSSAEAASLAAAEPDTAAIGAEQAAVNNGLSILARNIEDNAENVTRFAVIGANAAERSGRDKTALVFEAPHEPGSLADAMAIFKRHRLNLTWIESFPIPSARGRYLFFLEFQGHPAELRVKRAIASLQKKSLRLSLLGSYAESEVVG
ncbi:prephenate dehydratase [Lacipirellula sp.]|uniref:prephenate dehydratase n=1 Tax=Lacipirellula sp. TaxID=2691419 RepID=UPI003D0A490F